MLGATAIVLASSCASAHVLTPWGYGAVHFGERLEVAARAKHPKGRLKPHKYDEHGHYFVLDAPKRKAALLFEEASGRITGVRAGLQPSVEYVEGCL
jgi:hypothetical protein